MTTWDDAAEWYVSMVRDPDVGFNRLASDVAMALLGDVGGVDVLDVGAGEGHVARRLARAGARVVGIEPVDALRRAALAEEAAAPLGIAYGDDRAEALGTIADASFDAVAAVLVLHHVADLTAALRQVRRALRPGGSLVVVVPHPWSDHPGADWAGTSERPRRVVGHYGDEGFWRERGARGTERSVRQIGWHHRTVATWLTTLAGAGFVLTDVLEPAGDASGRGDGGGPWAGVPRFLAWSARSP